MRIPKNLHSGNMPYWLVGGGKLERVICTQLAILLIASLLAIARNVVSSLLIACEEI